MKKIHIQNGFFLFCTIALILASCGALYLFFSFPLVASIAGAMIVISGPIFIFVYRSYLKRKPEELVSRWIAAEEKAHLAFYESDDSEAGPDVSCMLTKLVWNNASHEFWFSAGSSATELKGDARYVEIVFLIHSRMTVKFSGMVQLFPIEQLLAQFSVEKQSKIDLQKDCYMARFIASECKVSGTVFSNMRCNFANTP